MDIASLYLILALLFFLLPVAVYLATAEFRDRQVYWWCIGGVGTSLGFMLVGLRGLIPDVLSFYVAHVFFAIGFSFRSLSLRLEISTNIYRTALIYAVISTAYVLVFSSMVYMQASEFYRLGLAHTYLLLMSFDLLFISQAIYSDLKNKGGKLIAWMAVFILFGLLVRLVGYHSERGGAGVFEKGIDQYIGIFSILMGYVLGNFGFIQLRFEKFLEVKKVIDVQLADTNSKNKSLEEILEEKNELMRMLSLSAKANSMGTMLGAIAHEINQPLSAIRLNTELLMTLNRRSGDREGFQESLEHILEDNDRAAVVVSSLRKFFVKGSSEFAPLDMSHLVMDAHRILLPEARLHGVNVQADIEEDLWVKADQNQLQMVVLNLINNAVDAVTSVSGEKLVFIRLFHRENSIILEVSDNGFGVPSDRIATIFELFHTTKEKGMGMGLWLSRAIMDSHEGSIKLLKGPENETLFQVALPAYVHTG
jgi:signal transduction histidine kinase